MLRLIGRRSGPYILQVASQNMEFTVPEIAGHVRCLRARYAALARIRMDRRAWGKGAYLELMDTGMFESVPHDERPTAFYGVRVARWFPREPTPDLDDLPLA